MRVLYLASFFLLFCSSVFSETKVHVFGDSHSLEFQGIPNTVIYHLGPHTMHRLGRDGLHFLNLKSFSAVEEGDVVVFAFGEIDVRCHIAKQKTLKNRDLDEIIEKLAINYIKMIQENRAHFKHLMCIVYSIVPPTDRSDNVEFPKYGTIEERVQITQMLNERLKVLCAESLIPFLDVYHEYSDERGTLRFELSDHCVHIDHKQNQMIREKLLYLIADYFNKTID